MGIKKEHVSVLGSTKTCRVADIRRLAMSEASRQSRSEALLTRFSRATGVGLLGNGHLGNFVRGGRCRGGHANRRVGSASASATKPESIAKRVAGRND